MSELLPVADANPVDTHDKIKNKIIMVFGPIFRQLIMIQKIPQSLFSKGKIKLLKKLEQKEAIGFVHKSELPIFLVKDHIYLYFLKHSDNTISAKYLACQ